MHTDAITADTVHQTLRAIRSARPLTGSPLLHLAAATQALVVEHLADTPTARAAFLVRWLDDLAWRQLAQLRGDSAPAEGRPTLAPESALVALVADFRARSADRQAWAVLHFHYFSSSSLTLREIAAALGLGYNTVRRRVERGHELLAELLRERERVARSADSHGRNLPRPLTRFIGRETELGAIRALLAEHRLVTLIGPGGIGKSRLAIHLAHDLAADYPDGACFVEVATLVDERQVPQALLTTLGLREAPGLPLARTLTDHLAQKRMLLVIDNCEHLVGACSALIGELLRHCDGLQVLATSRETLFVDGGATWSVPPLALPPDPSTALAASLMHFDAPRLFGVRAAAARPGFQLTDANAARVGGICARLDGIPLAIELAAALTRYLPLDDLDARLVDRFALLKDGHHATRPGHETLLAAMDWSYELLAERERLLLQRLSVFQGGWTMEAAEAVCTGDGIAEVEVLALIARLEAKSLLVLQVASGERRFRMLETVRQYASAKLADAREVERFRDRHLAYCLRLAEAAEPHLEGPEQKPWLERLDAERANLRSAFDWILARGYFADGSRLAHCLFVYWNVRGAVLDADRITRSLLDADKSSNASPERLILVGDAAFWALDLNRPEQARAYFEEALAAATSLGRPRYRYFNGLARIAESFDHDYDRARELYRQGLSATREAGDWRSESAFLHNHALLALTLGEAAEARSLIEQGLAIDRELGDLFGIAMTLAVMGHACRDLGDIEAARGHYLESAAIGREIGSAGTVATSLVHAGSVAYYAGDWGAAAVAYDESLARYREHEHLEMKRLCVPLAGLGEALVQLGELSRARKMFEESLAICGYAPLDGELASTLGSLALLELVLGKPIRAARLLGAAESLREGASLSTSMLTAAAEQNTRDRIDGAISPEARAAAVAEGRAMTREQAVAYALGQVVWEVLGAGGSG